MKILIIGSLYEPDLGPSAPLFTMLSTHLAQRGHQVTVITMVPHYPSGRISAEFRKTLISSGVEKGVHVIRIGLPSVDRSKLLYRFLQYFCYQVGATVASFGQEYDVVLAANPFLTVWLPFVSSVVLRRKPSIYSVHDVYPDVGVTLGIFRNRTVISAAASLERFCLDRSTRVRILSESFRPGMHALGVPDSRISLIYDWVDTTLIQPLNGGNSFSRDFHLEGRFVILYAGNIGRSQGLEQVLKAAEHLSSDQEILFVLVGDGAAREALQEQARKSQLENVMFVPFQPRERLPEVLGSADISLVLLSKGIGYSSLPSKLYSIFASGRPVLASIDKGCETWEMISKADAGICIAPEEPVLLAETITMMKNNAALRKQLGQNGRSWAEKHHSPQSAAEQFERLLSSVLAGVEQ